MAKWASAAFLNGGLNYLKNTAVSMVLIKNYTAGDSYATVTGNALASVAMASGDYTITANGNNQQVQTASGKSANATASSTSGNNLHIAFTDGAANVIWVTDETTDQVITSPNPVQFPQLVYTANQPT